jgi:polyketide biosynthesis enoyl-CoA hydratase PksH
MDSYKIIYSTLMDGVRQITFNNAVNKNTLTIEFLDMFQEAVDKAANDPKCNVLVIRGSDGYFCTGMDFGAVEENKAGDFAKREMFVNLLRKLVEIPKVTIAFVDGKSIAGGVGIAAACDMTLATSESEFSLPEIIWGLLPALILPFITRRIGPNPTLRMTLTGAPLDAHEAKNINLIDMVGREADLKRLCFRLAKLDSVTVAEAKQFLLELCPLNENVRKCSLEMANTLMQRQSIHDNMVRFRNDHHMPWEK